MAQFPQVGGPSGSPNGRAEWHDRPNAPQSVRLFRVHLDSGGYDDGGAYWGTGKPLFCATDDADYRQFIRAETRDSAADTLKLPDWLLKRSRTPEGAKAAAHINPLLAPQVLL